LYVQEKARRDAGEGDRACHVSSIILQLLDLIREQWEQKHYQQLLDGIFMLLVVYRTTSIHGCCRNEQADPHSGKWDSGLMNEPVVHSTSSTMMIWCHASMQLVMLEI
jgi:hypothetical protein